MIRRLILIVGFFLATLARVNALPVNVLTDVTIGNNIPGYGVAAVGVFGQYNASLPTLTSGNFSAIQVDSHGQLLTSGGSIVGSNKICDPVTTSQCAAVTAGNLLRVDASGVIVPVSGTFWQSLQPVITTSSSTITAVQPTGTNLHVVADTGSTTAVTGNVTAVQPTGTNLHVVADTGSTTAVTGNVTAVQPTGTNLHVNVDNSGNSYTGLTDASPYQNSSFLGMAMDNGTTIDRAKDTASKALVIANCDPTTAGRCATVTAGGAITTTGTVTGTVTVGEPYGMTTDAQTATTASAVGLVAWNGTTVERLKTSNANQGVGTQAVGILANGQNSGGPAVPPIGDQTTAINIASATTVLIGAAGSGGNAVWITDYDLYIVSGTLPAFQFVQGTGATCGTGQTILSGTFGGIAGAVGENFPIGSGFGSVMQGADGNSICLKTTGTTPNVQGYVHWTNW